MALLLERYKATAVDHRCLNDLPTAVWIKEEESAMRFSFNWGLLDQSIADVLREISGGNIGIIPAKDNVFKKIIILLLAVNPFVYSVEGRGYTDYKGMLWIASILADQISFEGIGVVYGVNNRFESAITIVFEKAKP